MTGGHVLDEYAHLFGWRFWQANRTAPRLTSPFSEYAPVRTAQPDLVMSVCPTRRCLTGPSESHTCGIHLIAELHAAKYYIDTVRTDPVHDWPPGDEFAVSFGMAVGQIQLDPHWPQHSIRAHGYRLIAALAPSTLAGAQARVLSVDYAVPVTSFEPAAVHGAMDMLYQRIWDRLAPMPTPWEMRARVAR